MITPTDSPPAPTKTTRPPFAAKQKSDVVKPDAHAIPVRRSKHEKSWCIADEAREFFIDGFTSAIMFDVAFEPVAAPMKCVRGYESTGEAIGVVLKTENPVMPADAIRTAEVTYDPSKRIFHAKRRLSKIFQKDEVFGKADYLVLHEDGRAFAGWRE